MKVTVLASFVKYLHHFPCIVNRDLGSLIAIEVLVTFHCEGGCVGERTSDADGDKVAITPLISITAVGRLHSHTPTGLPVATVDEF